jgi:hypothetical protein
LKLTEETLQDDQRCAGDRRDRRGVIAALLGVFRGDNGVVLGDRGRYVRIRINRADP